MIYEKFHLLILFLAKWVWRLLINRTLGPVCNPNFQRYCFLNQGPLRGSVQFKTVLVLPWLFVILLNLHSTLFVLCIRVLGCLFICNMRSTWVMSLLITNALKYTFENFDTNEIKLFGKVSKTLWEH